MNYRIVNISATGLESPKSSILIIYTGGTIGMVKDSSGALVSFNFKQIIEKLPSLRSYNLKITVISFPKPIDSSDIDIQDWIDLGYIIYQNYNQYDGFVILHGTDTMAYSASALSFILEGINKPIIFTGAQLPIEATRSDARENLITALEIASAKQHDGQAVIPEVCICFNYTLFRGNRAKKIKSSHFNAFSSENYPVLAEAGIQIDYNHAAISKPKPRAVLKFHEKMDSNVVILKLFPGIGKQVVAAILNIAGLRGVILETFGAGNASSEQWLIDSLSEAISRGIIILNVSQCVGGRVIQGRYKTSRTLAGIGVLSGGDITTEAAVTKMMYLLGKEKSIDNIKRKLVVPLAGEMT